MIGARLLQRRLPHDSLVRAGRRFATQSNSAWLKGEGYASFRTGRRTGGLSLGCSCSEYEYIKMEKRDKVALITLNRPKV
eukprot:48123-Eustigmatos_ZCMA.PRE.1